MELFDKKFVHFMWDDELEGKEVFVADSMEDLIFAVENDGKCAVKTNALRYNGNNVKPFHAYMLGANSYTFAYYDPNYEVKKAYYKEGKKVQVGDYIGNWADCHGEPHWSDNCKYRIKPECPCEEKTFRPFKDCDELVEFWSKNYQTGFRPANTKPLIWVRLKVDKRERLIVAFGTDFVEIGNKAKAVPLQKLFDDYEFLDGSPCGKEC